MLKQDYFSEITSHIDLYILSVIAVSYETNFKKKKKKILAIFWKFTKEEVCLKKSEGGFLLFIC